MKNLPFYKVCKLLDELEGLICRFPPLLPNILKEKVSDAWIRWFKLHRDTLDAMHKDDPSVLFTLKPEVLDDRDYDIHKVAFERFLARYFYMTVEQRATFKKLEEGDGTLIPVWNPKAGRDDLVRNDIGYRVQCIMKHIGRDTNQETVFGHTKVTVQEVEDTLITIAAQNEGSSATIKSLADPSDRDTWDRLGQIYSRLQSSQGKWLTRIIHKDFGFQIPVDILVTAVHTSFPRDLEVKAKFDVKNLVPIRRRGETGIIMPSVIQPRRSFTKDHGTQTIPVPSVARSTKSTQLISPPPTRKPRPLVLSDSAMSSLNVKQSLPQQIPPIGSENIDVPQKTPTRLTHRSRRLSLEQLRSLQKSKSPDPLTKTIFTGTGQCKQTTNCAFHNAIFILSPCISSHLWLIDLLQSHGATYITSLLPLTRKVLPKRCPKTGKRVRKIALVEHGRIDQTIAFMKQIGALQLTRSNGKRDWIETCDWRLLEKIAGSEKGNESVEVDIWKHHRLGTV
ncbi:putative atp dependent dna ligase domain protein [Botrytis fragariae]|uniref:Putative atp dependent dna ligase domain protein n=1 Tax=Botrytis fragariae TaxID=1964551 RepID=A0A8H6ANV6_9HELO|nr:putative atp dependent dna ligase domain protein [Botrytis fragariae]KAF5870897.1 putative atp dependent dna ligase domain protein [Botrytis fragariae]